MADNEEQINIEIAEKGYFEGHSDWVTSIIVADKQKEEGQIDETDKLLISSSRDKTILIWKYLPASSIDKDPNSQVSQKIGVPFKSLHGHNHFVTDISLSQDSNFLISSSWDKTLRLWDLKAGKTSRIFQGHSKEVYTVQFSPDNRQIISAGADRGIKLWNTLADCKYTSEMYNHTDWVSCIRYSPLAKQSSKMVTQPYFVSVGWDGRVKVWNTNFQIRSTFKAHDGNINCVDISPNQKYFATGGKDRIVYVWDINDVKEPLLKYETNAPINKISFNPKQQWIACATDKGIQIFDLMLQQEKNVAISSLYYKQQVKSSASETKKKEIYTPCTSLTWGSSGLELYGGFANGMIKVWDVAVASSIAQAQN